MRSIYIILALGVLAYLCGAFIYGTLNSGLWPVPDKIGIVLIYLFILGFLFGPMDIGGHQK